jgi:hypothetical protein
VRRCACRLLRRAPVHGSKPLVAEEGVADTDCADSLMGASFTRVSPITGRFRVAQRDPVQIVDAHRQCEIQAIQGFTSSALGGTQPAAQSTRSAWRQGLQFQARFCNTGQTWQHSGLHADWEGFTLRCKVRHQALLHSR